MFIDSHCHIEEETYPEGVDAVLQRAQAAGLSHCITVGATRGVDGAYEAIACAQKYAMVYATVGVHPQDVSDVDDDVYQILEKLSREPKVVAIGECGLDYHYENICKETQFKSLEIQIELAKQVDLPAMFHIRDAADDFLQIIDRVGLPRRGGVVHCFTDGRERAEQYIARGLYLSIPGVVTFRNAVALREAIPFIPLNKLLIETDSPYLTPMPYRGKRNEPAMVVHTAAKIAELLQLDCDAVGNATTENAVRFFNIK